MSLEKTEKGLVYKLSQKCLDQEEEIQNLIKNITVMQEVIEKKQTVINKRQAEVNMLKGQLNNITADYERIQQEDIINNFEDIKEVLEVIFKKVGKDKEIQKDMLDYLADQGEILKIFKV
jgi:hypothetical protein